MKLSHKYDKLECHSISAYDSRVMFKGPNGRLHNKIPRLEAGDTARLKVRQLQEAGPSGYNKPHFRPTSSIKINKIILKKGVQTLAWDQHIDEVHNQKCRDIQWEDVAERNKNRGKIFIS